MKEQNFIYEVKKLGIQIDENKQKLLKEYYNFLIEYNEKINLTTITDYENILLKHFYDSLTPVKVIDFKKINTIIDIGTGAGFPGIVLKIFFPHLELTLLDSNNKKIEFLKKLVQKLNLEKVNYIHGRAEELKSKEFYDVVIARAVKNLDILLEICLPLVKINGSFIAMKGKLTEELEDNLQVIDFLGGKLIEVNNFELPIEKSDRTIIRIDKNKKTPSTYPRLYSQILKKPLKKTLK